MDRAIVVNRFTLVIGALLLVAGVWGLFHPEVLFVLSSNVVLSIVLISVGGAGVWAARHQKARNACYVIGGVLLATGVLRLADWSSHMMISLFNMNVTGATLNVIIGTAALMIAVGPPQRKKPD